MFNLGYNSDKELEDTWPALGPSGSLGTQEVGGGYLSTAKVHWE